MISSMIKILFILILLVAFLYGTTAIAHYRSINSELLRKMVHSGLGLVCASFPWIFSATWELVVLCIGVLCILLFARYQPAIKEKIGLGLYGVKRSSVGDLLFGVTVVLLFHYSQGHANHNALYVLPLLILTLSDTAAALIGIRYGRHTFAITDGQKSWEGCMAFYGVTFLLTLIVLSVLTPLSFAHIFVIALILGIIGFMVEAVSWHGWDNLFVPLGLFLLLQSLQEQFLFQLLLALGVLIFILLAAYKLKQYSQLNTHALLGALLAAYFFWETGGAHWLLPPFIVFAVHVMLSCLQNDQAHESYEIGSVISIIATGIFWIFFSQNSSFAYTYYLFTLSLAIHVQIIILLRIRAQRGQASKYPLIFTVALFSNWLFLPTLLMYYPMDWSNMLIYAFGFIIMAAGGVLLQVNTEASATFNRWTLQGLYAAIGSVMSFIFIQVYTLWLQT